mgnify:CR=1 FL=1|jgi:arylsulfate sulfotransferase
MQYLKSFFQNFKVTEIAYTKNLSKKLKCFVIIILIISINSCSNEPDYYIDSEGLPYYKDLKEINTHLTINPSGISPLTANIDVSMDIEHSVSITIKGKNNDDITHDFENIELIHKIPILGLYSNHQNQVIISAIDRSGIRIGEKSVRINTDSIPLSHQLPKIEIIASELTERYTFVEHHKFFTKAIPLIFDKYGEVRWYLKFEENTGEFPFFIKDSNKILVGNNGQPVYYHYNWLGEITKEISLIEDDMTAHHSMTPHPDGGDIILIDNEADIGSLIYHLDENGAVIKSWNLNQILLDYLPDEQDMMIPATDWFHSNYALYDESDNSIIVSGRSSIGVIKLDYDTGIIKWILGDHDKKWYQYPGLRELALKPSPGTELPLGQHCPIKLPNGNLLLMDNGWDGYERNGSENGLINGGRQYSRLVEYNIDPVDLEVTQVFEFGKAYGTKLYSRYVGNTGYDIDLSSLWGIFGAVINPTTPDNPSIEGHVIEVDESGSLLFHAKISSESGTDFNYRTEKIDFYK